MRFAIGMQALEQAAVEAEVGAQHLGDGEGEMPVGNRVEDGPAQKLAEELDLLLACLPAGRQVTAHP